MPGLVRVTIKQQIVLTVKVVLPDVTIMPTDGPHLVGFVHDHGVGATRDCLLVEREWLKNRVGVGKGRFPGGGRTNFAVNEPFFRRQPDTAVHGINGQSLNVSVGHFHLLDRFPSTFHPEQHVSEVVPRLVIVIALGEGRSIGAYRIVVTTQVRIRVTEVVPGFVVIRDQLGGALERPLPRRDR